MSKPTVYGYARISTRKQNITRQINNIKAKNPDAVIIQETFSGTTLDRPQWNKLHKRLKAGDTVIFDEVSRMSRDAAEGMALYESLFDAGINLVFIKEPHINTEVFRQTISQQMAKHTETGRASTDKLISAIMEALHDYTIDVAKEQIEIAFQQAQAEVDHLHQRTREGVLRAQAEGKQVGRATGSKIETKKAKESKQRIRELSKDFDGSFSDKKILAEYLSIDRGTYYKYKREMLEEAAE